MKYNSNGDPADLEAAYRWICKAGGGRVLDPIKEYIVELEAELAAHRTVAAALEVVAAGWRRAGELSLKQGVLADALAVVDEVRGRQPRGNT